MVELASKVKHWTVPVDLPKWRGLSSSSCPNPTRIQLPRRLSPKWSRQPRPQVGEHHAGAVDHLRAGLHQPVEHLGGLASLVGGDMVEEVQPGEARVGDEV